MTYTKETIFSKIGELLLEINDDYTRLSDQNSETSDEALLLFAAKATYLVSHVEVLRKITAVSKDGQISSREETFTPPASIVGEADAQPVFEEIQEVEPPTDALEESQAEPQVVADAQRIFPEEEITSPQKNEIVSPKVEVTPVVREVIEEPKEIVLEESRPAPPVETMEETPTRPLTLNEMLLRQRKEEPSLPTSSNTPEKITDLKSSISLNDKLLFIKDLFNGYSLAYSEAIELLNRYASFAEADAFLQTNYALKNNWADKPQTVEKLYAILRKKFVL